MKIRFPWMLAAMCVLTAPAAARGSDFPVSSQAVEPLAGKVASLKYTEIVIRSDQNRDIALIIDSHTLIPPDLATGLPVRIEYSRMHDGRYHAERVLPFRPELLPPGAEERSYLPDAAMAWIGRWQVTRPAAVMPGPSDARVAASPWALTLPSTSYANVDNWNPYAILGGLLLSACVLLARSWRPRPRARAHS